MNKYLYFIRNIINEDKQHLIYRLEPASVHIIFINKDPRTVTPGRDKKSPMRVKTHYRPEIYLNFTNRCAALASENMIRAPRPIKCELFGNKTARPGAASRRSVSNLRGRKPPIAAPRASCNGRLYKTRTAAAFTGAPFIARSGAPLNREPMLNCSFIKLRIFAPRLGFIERPRVYAEYGRDATGPAR